MQLRKSERKRAKIKMALQGSAGSGKTMSSILLSKGLTNNNLEKVAIIDSEHGSSDLYSNLGNYNVLNLKAPFTPEKYIKAIDICLDAGMECIVIDSLSHTWDELLDYHSKLPGNSFSNWSKITPRLNALINKILQSDVHFIVTMRTKQDYVLNQKDGKYIPEKVGLKSIMRDGVDFEFTIVLDIDSKNYAVSSKDRTNLFSGKSEFKITEKTGRHILDWCNEPINNKPVSDKIQECLSVSQLMKLYKESPQFQHSHKEQFMSKKQQLENLVKPQNFSSNGTSNHLAH
ncbi:AAA family ATPase [Tenacibaculum maritimum]|uniref:AAA family ATPase n=1 Tax=Tenacibaculum maritimum TaxID=107401 RepID=UPI0010A57A71|nr:AAA family ATPase [Tenacibaculum maritimum]QCD61114.1 AAA family ATPase [Tenacibaculum maritimum]